MNLEVSVDASSAERALRGVRSKLAAQMRKGIAEAATRQVLPAVRRRAPSVVEKYLTAKGMTSGRASITTKGARVGDRITGLLNFGGSSSTPITPGRGKRAVSTPWGPRSIVYRGSGGIGKPSVITGKHFLERGVDDALTRAADTIEDHAERAFDDFG